MKDTGEIIKIISFLQKKVENEILKANRTGIDELEIILKKWNYVSDPKIQNNERKKYVLIIGDSTLSENEIRRTATEIGFDPNLIEQRLEYDKSFNFQTLKHSKKFSDILFGPIPHKVKGFSNIITEMERNAKDWPNPIRLNEGGKLKITKQSLKEGLLKSHSYSNLW